MPSSLPLGISLVAWSSTSDGPLVKMLSRCGSVLAQRPQAEQDFAGVVHVHYHGAFGEYQLAPAVWTSQPAPKAEGDEAVVGCQFPLLGLT